MTTERNLSIKALNEDDIKQAFEKTQNKFRIPGIKLVLVTEGYYEKALNLYNEQFLPHEPLCKSVALETSEIVDAFMLETFKKHLSLMFIDEKTEEPVAFRITTIISRDDLKFDFQPPIPLQIQDLMQYLHHCNEQADFFNHFGVDEAFRFVALVVADKYRRRGLATQIFHAEIDFIGNLGFERVYVKGEGSSNYSKKIYEKEGFKTLYESVYDTWEVDGRHPFTNTGEHKSIKIYGRCFDKKEK